MYCSFCRGCLVLKKNPVHVDLIDFEMKYLREMLVES